MSEVYGTIRGAVCAKCGKIADFDVHGMINLEEIKTARKRYSRVNAYSVTCRECGRTFGMLDSDGGLTEAFEPEEHDDGKAEDAGV